MALETRAIENRILAHTDWEGYLRCREALERGNVRITYDGGMIEFMSPSEEHEHAKSDVGHLLAAFLEEKEIDYAVGGGPTMRIPREKGLEPDDSFYIGVNAPLRGAVAPPERDVHPPDLVIEIEVSRSALNRLEIFQRLGVREVWRYLFDEQRIVVHRLTPEGTFHEQDFSSLLPDLPLGGLAHFVQRGTGETTGRIVADFRSWVRRGCPPLP